MGTRHPAYVGPPGAAGNHLPGRVRFENLSPLELGALLSALELPESQRHHLGMGRPLGMGSVQITTELHIVEPERRYRRLFTQDGSGLELGDAGAERAEEVRKQALEEFRSEMVNHHRAVTDPGLAMDTPLWDISRLRHLAVLLEWDRRPNREWVAYGSLEGRDSSFASATSCPRPWQWPGSSHPQPDQHRRGQGPARASHRRNRAGADLIRGPGLRAPLWRNRTTGANARTGDGWRE